MKEEISKRNNELSDAALENVSGGTVEARIQKACNQDCPAHKYPSRRSSYCAFEGTEAEREAKVFEYITHKGVPMFTFSQCPYYKR